MLELEAPRDWQRIKLRCFAEETKERSGDRDLAVLSVTKYAGLVHSGDYFSRTVHSRDTSNYKVLRAGDFAYATIHLDEGSIDYLRPHVAEEGAVSPMYTVFRVDTGVACNEFLKLLLRSEHALRVWQRLGKGSITRRKSIPFKTLGRVGIPLPSLAEQRNIAAIISSVDDAIEATRKVIKQTKRVKQGLLQTLMTRGIGHTRFKQTEIGEIPEQWEAIKVASLGEVKGGRQRSPHSQGVPRPYLRVANVFDGFIDSGDLNEMPFDDKEFERYRLQNGDILLNEGQSLDLVGRSAIYRGCPENCAFQNTLIRFRADDRMVTTDFAHLLFQHLQYSGRFSEIASRTTSVAHLGLRRFANLHVPVPPLLEQRRIAETLRAIDDVAAAEKSIESRYCDLKRGLMQDLLTGRVRVQPD